MAKTNYQYEKRQKDLAKKKKRDEKRLKRQNKNAVPEDIDENSENAEKLDETASDDK